MKTVLIDMDGVLADFDGPLFDLFRPHLDIESPEDQTKRFLTDHIRTPGQREAMRNVVEAPGWFRELPVIPGAQEGIERLSEVAELIVVSKPLESSATCPSEKFAWISEHFPSLVGKVYLAPDKSRVTGDFLLDDAIKASWLARATWKPIVYRHPWNTYGKYALGGVVPRASWDRMGELLDIVDDVPYHRGFRDGWKAAEEVYG